MASLSCESMSIVPFLDKDVSYVLTDVPGCNGKTSTVADNSNIVSPICYSVSPATSVSGDDNVNKKSRTRAEAMLERVPTQTQSLSAVNPISNAISWSIPVYSVDIRPLKQSPIFEEYRWNMVSPEKNKKKPGTEFSVFGKNSNSKKRRKASSLLKSKKIFLYFKNHQNLSKYEIQLKSFGASIVPFLDKDVSYVLTDVPGCNGKTSAVADNSNIVSPICYSVSPATSVSGDDNVNKKSRTRAEAMLERVPTQTQSVSAVNPISNAISWSIPVYSVDIFQNWLVKKLSQIQLVPDPSEANNDPNTKLFTKRFIKVECLVKNKYRPEFREVSKWPSIHLNSLAGSCPFDKKSSKKSVRRDRNHADEKKESDKMNRTCNKVTNESGYCEICAVHYKDLTQHVTESTHLKFVCNEKNYTELDSCIKTRSVDSFLAAHNSGVVNSQTKESGNIEEMGRNLRKSVSLHLNNNNENSAVTKALSNPKLLDESLKRPLQVQCNGFTNYHLRKTTTKSDGVCYEGADLLRESRKMYASCPDANLPATRDVARLSPLGDESMHRLRSRRNLILPSILIGTTAEDASRHRGISSQTSNRHLRSPRSCTYAARGKLPDHVNEEAAAVGEVSSSPVSANHAATTPHKEAKHSITSDTHFTRSKLNIVLPMVDAFDRQLSHEPSLASPGRPAKRKASALSDDEQRPNGAASPTGGFPIAQKFKIALCNNVSPRQADAAAERGNYNRKRMSAEEKLLEDNKAYYKVEMLRTKLRSTESYCSQVLYAPGKDESGAAEADAANGAVEPRVHKLPKRNSALHLLNLEAEKFMFGSPKRDDEEGEEDERQGRAASDGSIGEERAENGVDDEPTAYAEQNGRRKGGKKRRTHAELFIHDNLDYYKFEISGCRLRHQGDHSGSASVHSEAHSCSFEAAKIKEEVVTDDDEAAVGGAPSTKKLHRASSCIASNLGNEPSDTASSADASCCGPSLPPPEAVCFSFESVPAQEPWYRAFQRYDSCDEQCLRTPRTVYFSRYRDTQPPPARRDKQSVAFAGGVKDAAPGADAGSSSSSSSLLARHFRRKGRQKIIAGRVAIDDKPRKSPRCHASTLAILSSLTSHRRRSRKLLETKRASVPSAPKGKKVVPAEPPKAAAAESSVEQQQLRETFSALAKEADEHFIDVFGRDDCEDRYLRGSSGTGATKRSEASHDWRKCLLVDESILRDDETLKWFAEGSLLDGGAMMDDMCSFLEDAQRCCTSMESAAEEEWSGVAAQHRDTLSRLCRENDFSCNSSECGASSTCEFLGFSEDGRSVSRKRKRKRPNMTGWPKRRHMRFAERRRANIRSGDSVAGSPDLRAGDDRAASEAAASTRTKAAPSSSAAATSEADSECSEDDVPLVNILHRKKRRTNSTAASSEDKGETDSVAASPRAAPRQGRGFPLSRRKCENSSPSKTSSVPRAAARGLAACPRRRGRKLPLSRRTR